MEATPEVYLGQRKLDFSLGFPYSSYLRGIDDAVLASGVDHASDDYIERFSATYQERLAAEVKAATGLVVDPAPVTGKATAGPALINIDYLQLLSLLVAADLGVAVINNWADMAERVVKAIRWLKSKAAGELPVVSDGVALILGSKALIDATGRKDLAPSFVSELGQFPPQREDEPPEIEFDYLVGARTKRWMYLCRVSCRGDASYVGRVRFSGGEPT
jgi:hypothetical protein